MLVGVLRELRNSHLGIRGIKMKRCPRCTGYLKMTGSASTVGREFLTCLHCGYEDYGEVIDVREVLFRNYEHLKIPK